MRKRKLSQVQREAKILLAKAIIKNWEQATEQKKKEIEKWWKETYGEFKNS
jgi:hypothetical protein